MIRIYSTSKTKIIELFRFIKFGYKIYRLYKAKGFALIFGILDTEVQIVIARRSKDGKDNKETKGPRAFA
jgi:hypothetical protein